MILSLIALISSLLNLFDNRLFVRIDGFDPTRFVEITTYAFSDPSNNPELSHGGTHCMPIWSTALLKYAEASGLTVDNLFRNVSDSSVILPKGSSLDHLNGASVPPSKQAAR